MKQTASRTFFKAAMEPCLNLVKPPGLFLLLLIFSVQLFGNPIGEAPQITVQGTVTDSLGEALPGVSINIQGTDKGTVTDGAGKYILADAGNNDVLVFSYIGFDQQIVPIGGRSEINIVLQRNNTGLGEVVVVGYGTQKKATVTGAISSVKGEVLQQSPAINFTNTLAGRLPGLVTVNSTGEPGRDNPTIRIRGVNTLRDNSVLIVVDGVQDRDITSLRPEDIESVTVLKDASGAIYGSRAANGVILITTKRGRSGRPEVTLNLNYGISKPTVIPEMADAATYATMMNEIYEYDGQSPAYTPEEIQKFRDGSDPWRYPNTDWFGAVFKPSTPQTRSDISIRGGNESMRYFLSGGYSLQDAIYKNSSSKFSQVNFRANIDGKITDNISLSLDLAGNQENRNFAANPYGYMINRSKPMFIATYPGNKPAAGYQAGQSPVVLASDWLGYDRRRNYNFLSNLRLVVDIPQIQGLSLTGNVAFDKNILNSKLWRTPYMLYSWDRETFDANGEPVVTGALDGPYTTPELNHSFTDGHRVTINGLLNYVRNFGVHNVKFLAGSERITGETMDLSAFRRGFVSTALDQMFAGGDPDKNNGGSASVSARLNYFGRVNYDYMNKYLLEFVWRTDGSYIFRPGKQFGFFPGVSAGWVISEESFWANSLPFVNYLKIMGSYGKTGNDRVNAYQYLSIYRFGSVYIFDENLESKTLNEVRIPNPEATWEEAHQTNIGFEAQLLQGKVKLAANYFNNIRSQILVARNASVPGLAGLTLPDENIGKVQNRGYELELGYTGNAGDFHYNISANAAYAKNKILFWDEAPGAPDYQRSTGKSIGANLYYIALDVFQDQAALDKYPHWSNARPGDIRFKDVNGDGKIDGLDLVRYEKTDIPTLTGGLTIDLGYKNFYASIFFQGAAGAMRSYTIESGLIGNFLADDAIGRWTEDNPNSSKPRTWNTGGTYWTQGVSGGTAGINNTYWLKNNDYLRLKTFQLGYRIPQKLLNKVNINGLTVYVGGLNLLTFTSLRSFDPETVGNVYPLSKVYDFGLRLTL